MIFEAKRFGKDIVWTFKHIKQGGLKEDFKKLGLKIKSIVTKKGPDAEKKRNEEDSSINNS